MEILDVRDLSKFGEHNGKHLQSSSVGESSHYLLRFKCVMIGYQWGRGEGVSWEKEVLGWSYGGRGRGNGVVSERSRCGEIAVFCWQRKGRGHMRTDFQSLPDLTLHFLCCMLHCICCTLLLILLKTNRRRR